jgi:hypothetical protein
MENSIVKKFVAALIEDEDLAIRILLWARDVRGGVGERMVFRVLLNYLEIYKPSVVKRIIPLIPEVGRFDDLLVFKTDKCKRLAFQFIKEELGKKNGLIFKWLPREKSTKKEIALELMKFLGMSPKQYRKMLAENTKVVESQMCAKDFDSINFEQVPSVASARYRKAFERNTPKYKEYVDALVKGEATVNASSIFPHDVIKGIDFQFGILSQTQMDFIVAQWNALPNFVGESNILPMVDVSGSMTCIAGNKGTTRCIDVSLALGVYLADKNKGKFKDTFLTFSAAPELVTLKGNVIEKFIQMNRSKWDMNTDLSLAFDKVLRTAKDNNVPVEEMPEIILILSDMNFDRCVGGYNDSAIEMIERKYNEAGYSVPKVVFWNLNAQDHCPVKFDESGTALVSGFSPAILTALLSGDLDEFNPWNIMMKAIMIDRYNWRCE